MYTFRDSRCIAAVVDENNNYSLIIYIIISRSFCVIVLITAEIINLHFRIIRLTIMDKAKCSKGRKCTPLNCSYFKMINFCD